MNDNPFQQWAGDTTALMEPEEVNPFAKFAMAQPEEEPKTIEPESAWQSGLREFKAKALPAIGTALGGAGAGLLATPETVGFATIPAAIAGGAAGGAAGEKLYQTLMGEEEAKKEREQMAVNAEAHPWAATAGSAIPTLVSLLGGGGLAKTIGQKAAQRALSSEAAAGLDAAALKALGQKAAAEATDKTLVKVGESAMTGAKLGASETAQRAVEGDDVGAEDFADSMARNAVAFGPFGVLPHVESLAKSLGMAVPQAYLSTLAGSAYDSIVHGKPFDIKDVAGKGSAEVVPFALFNAIAHTVSIGQKRLAMDKAQAHVDTAIASAESAGLPQAAQALRDLAEKQKAQVKEPAPAEIPTSSEVQPSTGEQENAIPIGTAAEVGSYPIGTEGIGGTREGEGVGQGEQGQISPEIQQNQDRQEPITNAPPEPPPPEIAPQPEPPVLEEGATEQQIPTPNQSETGLPVGGMTQEPSAEPVPLPTDQPSVNETAPTFSKEAVAPEVAHEEFDRRAYEVEKAGATETAKRMRRASEVVRPLLQKYGAAFDDVRYASGINTVAAVSGRTLVLDPEFIANALDKGIVSPKSMEAAMTEEVAHPAVDHATARMIANERGVDVSEVTPEEVTAQHEADWKALPKRVQQESERLYHIAAIERARRAKGGGLTEAEIQAVMGNIDSTDATRGSEFKRQVMQDRIWGVLTEEAQANPSFHAWLKNFLKELIASIKNVASKLSGEARAKLDELEQHVRQELDKLGIGERSPPATSETRKAPETVAPSDTVSIQDFDDHGNLTQEIELTHDEASRKLNSRKSLLESLMKCLTRGAI